MGSRGEARRGGRHRPRPEGEAEPAGAETGDGTAAAEAGRWHRVVWQTIDMHHEFLRFVGNALARPPRLTTGALTRMEWGARRPYGIRFTPDDSRART